MCMVDDGEPWDVYNASTPRARKPAKCTECSREIAIGERYHRVDGCVHGQGWDTFRMCEHCRAAAEWLVRVCDGYPLGMVRDDLDNHAAEYDDAWLTEQVGAMRRKWQRFDGNGMMPLPELPADLSRFVPDGG